jgi:hypothetical protein
MREHRKNPERTGIYSVVLGAKSPNRNGIWEFWPEFRRNLQPSPLTYFKVCIKGSPTDYQSRLKSKESPWTENSRRKAKIQLIARNFKWNWQPQSINNVKQYI